MDVGRELYPLTAIVRILLAQLGIGLIVAGAGFGVAGGVAAWSALLGSLVCVLPNAFLLTPRPGRNYGVKMQYRFGG